MMEKYRQALDDARRAITFDKTFEKGYIRIAKCCLALGDLKGLEKALKQIKEYGIEENMSAEIVALDSIQRKFNEAETHYSIKDYIIVVDLMNLCLELCTACDKFKLLKSECLARLGQYEAALKIADEIFDRDSTNADALFVRGLCQYYMDEEQDLKHIKHVLKLAPDYKKALEFYKKSKLFKKKIEDGKKMSLNKELLAAYKLYNEAIEIDPYNKIINVSLFLNCATICLTLGMIKEAIENCTKALKIDQNYTKAFTQRAKCYSILKNHEEAIRDYESLLKLDDSQTNKRLLQDAKLTVLIKSKPKNYYQILGVENNASDDKIKKAYREISLMIHPDKHRKSKEEKRRELENYLKKLNKAYSVLSNPSDKYLYDCNQYNE